MSKAKIKNCGSTMSGDWMHFWSPRYGAEENAGGVCIVCGENWKEKVLHTKIIIQGRAQFIILENGDNRLGILNVYAPSARASLWETIHSTR